jgi:hypothetical protein
MKEEKFGIAREIIDQITELIPDDFVIYSTKSEYCYGYTVEGVDFRFYVPSDNFLMLQLSSEDLKLVNIFSKALGYQPCCRYNNDVGFFVFEWVKKGENERLTELIEEARKGKIIQLRSLNSIGD